MGIRTPKSAIKATGSKPTLLPIGTVINAIITAIKVLKGDDNYDAEMTLKDRKETVKFRLVVPGGERADGTKYDSFVDTVFDNLLKRTGNDDFFEKHPDEFEVADIHKAVKGSEIQLRVKANRKGFTEVQVWHKDAVVK